MYFVIAAQIAKVVPTHLNNIGLATLTIWVAKKKYMYRNEYISLQAPGYIQSTIASIKLQYTTVQSYCVRSKRSVTVQSYCFLSKGSIYNSAVLLLTLKVINLQKNSLIASFHSDQSTTVQSYCFPSCMTAQPENINMLLSDTQCKRNTRKITYQQKVY